MLIATLAKAATINSVALPDACIAGINTVEA
jgi:hypothetical protein